MTIYGLLKRLKLELVVRHKDGSICTVVSFDITKQPHEIPVQYKRICSGDEFWGVLPDITHCLEPVEL